MIEPVPVLGTIFLRKLSQRHRIINARSVGEENVEATVVVVIQQGDARTHCLGKIFSRCRGGLMLEMNPQMLSFVYELSGDRLRFVPLRIL